MVFAEAASMACPLTFYIAVPRVSMGFTLPIPVTESLHLVPFNIVCAPGVLW